MSCSGLGKSSEEEDEDEDDDDDDNDDDDDEDEDDDEDDGLMTVHYPRSQGLLYPSVRNPIHNGSEPTPHAMV